MGIMQESNTSNRGDGCYVNSSHKQTITAMDIAKKIIDETIDKFDITKIPYTSNTFCIADFGCSVGPNTFLSVQNIIEAFKRKFTSQLDQTCNKMPKFQVFFNDLVFNDFNALFKTLPLDREYFAAGVPGSFYNQLFPQNALHFAISSYALQWLSEVPPRVLDNASSAWNKGRIHYTCASNEVVKAYAEQFANDMGKFLDARAEELAEGGMLLIIMPSHADGILHSNIPFGVLFQALEYCFMDMVNEVLISKDLVDSFNIPLYNATPKEMTEVIQKNGCFSIERMEPANCSSEEQPSPQEIMTVLRAGMEGVITKHFGLEIIDELFDRFEQKIEELMHLLRTSSSEGSQLTIFLKRRPEN